MEINVLFFLIVTILYIQLFNRSYHNIIFYMFIITNIYKIYE